MSDRIVPRGSLRLPKSDRALVPFAMDFLVEPQQSITVDHLPGAPVEQLIFEELWVIELEGCDGLVIQHLAAGPWCPLPLYPIHPIAWRVGPIALRALEWRSTNEGLHVGLQNISQVGVAVGTVVVRCSIPGPPPEPPRSRTYGHPGSPGPRRPGGRLIP